jgi:hypothetical protein
MNVLFTYTYLIYLISHPPHTFQFASTIVAAEKLSTNSTVGVVKTKEARDKRNLNVFGNFASRREDGYNYQPSSNGYSKNKKNGKINEGN